VPVPPLPRLELREALAATVQLADDSSLPSYQSYCKPSAVRVSCALIIAVDFSGLGVSTVHGATRTRRKTTRVLTIAGLDIGAYPFTRAREDAPLMVSSCSPCGPLPHVRLSG
jgi:hypothetical protein